MMTHDQFIEKADNDYGELTEREYLISRHAYRAGHSAAVKEAELAAMLPSKAVAVAKPKKADIDHCFDIFWQSGIRKAAKVAARKAFAKAMPSSGESVAFAHMLCRDVAARLQADQLGFAELYPASYLNGERWEDEIKPREGVDTPLFDCFGVGTTVEKEVQGNIFDQIDATVDDSMAFLLTSRARLESPA